MSAVRTSRHHVSAHGVAGKKQQKKHRNGPAADAGKSRKKNRLLKTPGVDVVRQKTMGRGMSRRLAVLQEAVVKSRKKHPQKNRADQRVVVVVLLRNPKKNPRRLPDLHGGQHR